MQGQAAQTLGAGPFTDLDMDFTRVQGVHHHHNCVGDDNTYVYQVAPLDHVGNTFITSRV